MTAPVPGVRPEAIDISVLGDSLRIRGERKEEREEEGEGKRWLMREQRYGAFERMVTLPTPVKADKATADFKDGILTITLPKTEEAKPKSILVRSGAGQRGQAQDIEIANR